MEGGCILRLFQGIHPLFMSAHLRAGAVSRTEDASGAAGGCPQSVESAVLWAFEDASRTVGGGFWHGTPLMRRVPQKAVFGTEYLFRTGKACFAHRVPQKTPSVQKKGVFMHRMPFPYRRSLFMVPSPLKPSRSSLTLLKSAFIVTICFQTNFSPYVASTPLHITRG